jgi:transcriptional regulator with XRE-family HTH domain
MEEHNLNSVNTEIEIEHFKVQDFGSIIAEAIRKKGYTKAQVARHLGIDRSYMGKIVKNVEFPSERACTVLSSYIEIPEDFLLKKLQEAKLLQKLELVEHQRKEIRKKLDLIWITKG